MNPITTNCPRCAEQVQPMDDIRLVQCSYEPWSFYEFVCPACCHKVRLPAPPSTRRLLLRHGVLADFWSVPAEAVEEHSGPPITVDDLRDFVLALGGIEDAVDELRNPRGSR
jgi:hypothetical protein